MSKLPHRCCGSTHPRPHAGAATARGPADINRGMPEPPDYQHQLAWGYHACMGVPSMYGGTKHAWKGEYQAWGHHACMGVPAPISTRYARAPRSARHTARGGWCRDENVRDGPSWYMMSHNDVEVAAPRWRCCWFRCRTRGRCHRVPTQSRPPRHPSGRPGWLPG